MRGFVDLILSDILLNANWSVGVLSHNVFASFIVNMVFVPVENIVNLACRDSIVEGLEDDFES